MDQTERIIFMGFAPGDTPRDIDALASDLALARILVRRGRASAAQLEAAVRVRNETGLLLEHCLVGLGHVDFDAMLEAMAERRALSGGGPAGRLSVTPGTASGPLV